MPPATPWHALGVKDVLPRLQSQLQGLTEKEAALRLQATGENTVPAARRISHLRRFLRQLHDPLVYILLAAGLTTALLQHWTDTGVIAAVILLDALIGFIQEQKAENALDAIRQLLSPQALVLRDGKTRLIPARQLVTGDIVLLAAGDKVPADIRLLAAHNLYTQEAALTGESLDVGKSTAVAAENANLGDRACMVYSSTLVTRGQGKGIVTATGVDTEIGHIGSLLGTLETPETPLTRKLAVLSRWLAGGVAALAAAVFAFGVVVRGLPPLDMFMVMIAIAVAAVPEGLPAVISITLAVGVNAMAKRNAIVRHLPVIEALGSATVICTDKTGTLTKNELTVTDVLTREEHFNVEGTGYAPKGGITRDGHKTEAAAHPALFAMGQGALLNNDAALVKINDAWDMNGDPTEGALLAFAFKAGQVREQTEKDWPRADVLPFSAESRYMATLHHGADGSVIYVKGAPENIFAMCAQERHGTRDAAFDLAYWQEQVDALARQGKRVLAMACRTVNKDHGTLKHDHVREGLTLLGLFGIIDTPREEAHAAVTACRKAGITVKMITGDHALTAAAIGHMLGIPHSERVMTGADMEKLTEEQRAAVAHETNIYARMQPAHKMALVKALQVKSEVVAMTGDGVNDAPALKSADIGVAMGKNGTEVAKEASSLVLADDNFATIVHAVAEGRNVYRNIRRTIQFMLVTDGCEGLTLVIATLAGFTLPVTALQILWVNMVTAVTLSLSFAFAPYSPDVMRRAPIPLKAPVFSRAEVLLFLCHVAIIAGGTIGMFFYTMHSASTAVARTVAVNTLVCFQVYYLWSLLLEQKDTKIKSFAAPLSSTAAIIALQLLFTYTPWMQKTFSTAPLDARNWGAVVATGALISLWLWGERRVKNIKDKRT